MSLPAIAAALIFATLGVLHAGYTLYDIVRQPRYFRPKDRALIEAMQATKMALAPQGRDFWSALLGFHLSHSLGILLFALLILIAEIYAITWLMPVLAAVGALLTLIAWRCWFHVPTLGCLIGTGLIAATWVF